jgi:hypothetical protein
MVFLSRYAYFEVEEVLFRVVQEQDKGVLV